MISKNAATTPGWNQTELSRRLGIEYPIIQGPLGGFPSQKLAAAVSNFGGLGSIGALGLQPAALSAVIAEMRSLTSKPFAVNLWVSTEDKEAFTSGPEEFSRSLRPLVPHLESLGVKLPSYAPYVPLRFDDQVRVLLDAKVPVFSFIFGIPSKAILDECRQKGIITVGAATTPDEAAALEQAGVDAIAASGFEAGGHRGSFLRPAEESLTGTFSLVPEIVDRVRIPVIAAGGISDARGIVAALALGAQGVQIGTAFLACRDSGASQYHRQALLSGKVSTGLTKGFTGRLARGIQNQLMRELNQPGVEILPYPLQRALVKSLSAPAEKASRSELLPLWAGESANLCRFDDATLLLESLVKDVSAIADDVVRWREQRKSKSAQSSERAK